MKKIFTAFFVTAAMTLFLSPHTLAQTQTDSVFAGFTKVVAITENPDTAQSDRVAQMVVGGLDLNENGKKEFLYVTDNTFTGGRQSHYLGYSLFLYEYDAATTSYKNIWKYSIPDTVGGSFPVFCIADLNGNGHKEIVLGVQYGAGLPTPGANPDRLLVFEFGPGALPTTPTATWNFDAPAGSNVRPSALIAGDVDGDGVQELGIAFRAFSAGTKGIIIASVTGGFAGPFTQWKKELYDTTTATASIYGSARITDLNNNGKKEFTFGYAGSTNVYVFEAAKADSFVRSVINLKKGTTLSGGNTLSMEQADIRGDGKNELLFGASPADLYVVDSIKTLQTADSSQLVKRIGSINNVPKTTINEFRGLTAGDLDGNGKTDILMCDGGRVWRFEYKGTGLATDSSSYNTSIVYQDTTSGTRFRWVTFIGDNWSKSMGISAGDMDGDKKPEVLLANQRGGDPQTGVSKIVILESTTAVNSVEIGKDGQVISTYRLEQNYPNPFNPSTSIKFAMSHQGFVNLSVFDITGRKVATLVNESLAAGEHVAQFNASRLASGTYMYVLSVGGNQLTKKMLFVK
ncbi:MAG: FG-GAP-like repeat-containing protein [Bacteroidota bacterium]|nr:FG-GAP-like repeat-containing protein [Bacteroidota bacterium]